ncbi:MAG TPA: hypothetical protein VLA55_05485 [Ornithinibacter sp.]|jgi:hypothetical protein|nr:hypothetical protein [Ornithinibacter sp.]
MSERWTWSYEDAAGSAMDAAGLGETAFPTQSDAESWFGEVWQDLTDAGVAAVTLWRDGEKAYGPMSLEAAP